jgi:hypothetical protein
VLVLRVAQEYDTPELDEDAEEEAEEDVRLERDQEHDAEEAAAG